MFDNGDRVIIKNNPSYVFEATPSRHGYVDLTEVENGHTIIGVPIDLIEHAPVEVKPGQVWITIQGERLFVIEVINQDEATYVLYASAKSDPTTERHENFTSYAGLEHDVP